MARTTPPTMQLETVGETVRLLRSRLGLEQVELARACGWRDASAVSRIETDRIHPTRRTLAKLAENLSDPGRTGTTSEIRGWLFLAAGVLPTQREIDELAEQIPSIDDLPHPAALFDFAWTAWRANERLMAMTGLPPRFTGRNYVELFFQADGPIRSHLGPTWEVATSLLLREFRRDTDRRMNERWHRKLLASLQQLPDFPRIWDSVVVTRDGKVSNWAQTSGNGASFAMVRTPLTADPRLIVGHIIPENVDTIRMMLKQGSLLG
jgi:transcriptional regulator with XRE-family HTH domain